VFTGFSVYLYLANLRVPENTSGR